MLPMSSRSAPVDGAPLQGEDVSQRLVTLFARALREYDRMVAPSDSNARHMDLNADLERQISVFATRWRASERTPEQMLVELKNQLARAAPEVTGSLRAALTASATGAAIFRFFSP
jgi:hypothetical protein